MAEVKGEPLTEDELARIEAAAHDQYELLGNALDATDIPRLVAEVRRLRDALKEPLRRG